MNLYALIMIISGAAILVLIGTSAWIYRDRTPAKHEQRWTLDDLLDPLGLDQDEQP